MSFLSRQLRTLQRTSRNPSSIFSLTSSFTNRTFRTSSAKMGVTKKILVDGQGPIPKKGDTVSIAYTGYLKDTTMPENKGEKFDSSVDRGDFVVQIGVGQVIRGWDEGVTTMQVGEKATLDITSDFAYGDRGFPGHIPPNASLLFDVELKNIK